MTTYEIIEQLKKISIMRDEINEETGEYVYTEEEIVEEENKISAKKEEKLNATEDYKRSINDNISRFEEKKAVQDANIKRATREQDYLKELQSSLLDGEKIKTDEYSFYYTTSKSVEVVDIENIPDKYCKFEKKIIAKDVKAAMLEADKNGESFFGANLIEKRSLVVR